MNSESTINPAVWQSLNDMYLGYGLVQWDDGKLFIDWAKKEGVISAATAEAVNMIFFRFHSRWRIYLTWEQEKEPGCNSGV